MVTVTRRLGWLLKQNKRYAPLLDTGLKLAPIPLAVGALLALPMLFLFNAYLGQLNQPAIPVSQVGDWVFLLLFGVLVSVLFAVIILMPAAWTALVRWNAPALPERTVKTACGATALVTVGVLIATVWLGEEWSLLGLALATLAGGVAGARVTTAVQPPYARFAAAWAGFAASAFMIVTWAVSLWLLLFPMVEAIALDHPVEARFGLFILLIIMLCASIAKPIAGILVGILITGHWVTEQASPDGGVMIASALYTANLGGGRTAQTAQPNDIGEICNLGVGDRPVFYFEPKGCSRLAAFRRLRTLKGKDSLGRHRQLRLWGTVVARQPTNGVPQARPQPLDPLGGRHQR